MFDTIEKFLKGAALLSTAAITVILGYLIGRELWKQFGDDVKDYTSSQWQAFKEWQSKTRFMQWCQKVIEALRLKQYLWSPEQSCVFTQMNRESNTAQTVFQVDEETAFASDEYVLCDGESSEFIRATGKIIEMDDLMAKYLHTGVG